MRGLSLLLALSLAGCSLWSKGEGDEATRYKVSGFPAGGDLDGDGAEEIVGFTRDGLTRFDGKTGRPVWTAPSTFDGKDHGGVYGIFVAQRKVFLVFGGGFGELDDKGALAKFWGTTSDRVARTCRVGKTMWLRQLDQVDFGVDLASGERQKGPWPAECDRFAREAVSPWREAPAVWLDQRKDGVRYSHRYGAPGASVRVGVREPGTPEIHVIGDGPGDSERFHTVLERGTSTPPDQVDVVGDVVHVQVTYTHYGIDLATGRILYKVTTGGMDWRATATRVYVLKRLKYGRTDTQVYDAHTGAPIPPAGG